MKKLIMIVFVMVLATGAQALIITDDNFEGYNVNDVYTSVNSWGWSTWTTGRDPIVRASYSVSPPNGLFGNVDFIGWNMKNELASNVTGADIEMSFYVRGRNLYLTPLVVQFGESMASQDRVYFSAGGNASWTYKYMGLNGAWTDIVDFDGNPLEVGWGGTGGERFEKVVITMPWNGTDYGSTYNVQIFEVDGTPLSPVNACQILDADFQEDGDIDSIGAINLSAIGSNHYVWLDDLYIEVIPEPATMSFVGLALLALYRRK
jgi:PEP-CTERM motif